MHGDSWIKSMNQPIHQELLCFLYIIEGLRAVGWTPSPTSLGQLDAETCDATAKKPTAKKLAYLYSECEQDSISMKKSMYGTDMADCYLRQGDGGPIFAPFGSKTCFLK